MKAWLSAVVLSVFAGFAHAHEQVPGSQVGPTLLQHGTLHTVAQGVLHDQDIFIEDGEIKAIGQQLPVPEQAQIVDLKGQQVWPGLIALNTSGGLVEIGAVRATDDSGENAPFTPEITPFAAYNADSEVLPTLRSNGITHIEATPHGGMISGAGSLMQLDAWNADDAVVLPRTGMHIYWPNIAIKWTLPAAKRAKQRQQVQQQLDQLEHFLKRSRAYALALDSGAIERPDTRLDAMYGVFRGDIKVFIHADSVEQIKEAMAMMDRFELDWVLVGGYEAWRVAPQLKKRGISVVYTHALGLPSRYRKDEPSDAAYSGPKRLADAGLTFAIAPDGGSWEARNLAFFAGQAMAYGLSAGQALAAVTTVPARIAGIAEQQGALRVGLAATLVITKGNLFDYAGGKVQKMMIDGRWVDLNDRQKRLYHKYEQRLSPQQQASHEAP